MRRLASLVVVLLALTAAAPMLACVTGASMSREEHACCRSMRGQCGPQMAQMKDMGCCRTETRTDKTPQAAATTPAIAVSLHGLLLATATPLELPTLPLANAAFSPVPIGYSPPNLLIAKISVLRI